MLVFLSVHVYRRVKACRESTNMPNGLNVDTMSIKVNFNVNTQLSITFITGGECNRVKTN